MKRYWLMNFRVSTFLMAWLLFPGLVFATTYSLPGSIGSGPFSSCSFTSGTTYSCAGTVTIANNDIVNFNQSMTLAIVSAGRDFTVGNSAVINGNGYAVTITAADDINLGNSFVGSINFIAGDNFSAGNNATVTGNVVASDDVSFGNNTNVTGNVSAGEKLTVGSGTINGICSYSSTNYTCAGGLPSATTNPATSVTSSGATFHGTVTSNGAGTTVTFEYGLTTGYGSSTTATQSPLASSASGEAVSKAQTGLACNTTYNYRVKAVNASGTANGGNLTFTTGVCPTISIGNASLTEGNSGQANMTFTATLSAVSGTTASAAFTTSAGSAISGANCAVAGADFVASSGTVSVIAGATTGTFTVPVCGDTAIEIDKTFSVTLSSPSGATLATSIGTGTIVDNDFPTVSIAAATAVIEGASGTKTMSFPVSLSALAPFDVTVNYVTVNGTATGGDDFVAISATTLTIPAGARSGVILVDINGDVTYEGDESLTVEISAPTNSALGTATASGVILNDDAPPLVAEYRFDETVWNGTAGEVMDSSPNAYHATATQATAAIGGAGPAYSAFGQSTCGFGNFAGVSRNYVRLPDSFPGLSGSFSISAWVNSTNAAGGAQRIFVRDDDNNGWALSLADFTGTGILRFFNRNVSFNSPSGGIVSAGGVALDTTFRLSSNTWYYIGLTVETVGKTVVMYVYDTAGVLKSRMSASFTGVWGAGTGATAIGDETSASSEASYPFRGRIDEVTIYNGALTQTLVEALLPKTRNCSNLDHYAISYPLGSTGVTCEALAVAVTGHNVSDVATVPLAGTQIKLLTSPATGGWALKAGAGTFTAPNKYTFSGTESSAEFWLTQTTPLANIDVDVSDEVLTDKDGDATDDSKASFSDTAFKFYACTGAVPGTCAEVAINTQVAGINSNVAPASQNLYLRAIKSGTSPITSTCTGGLVGAQNIEMGYECEAPTSCAGANYLSVNGGAATTVSRNNDGAISSSAGVFSHVPLTFDSNGFTPFNLLYSDVGKITLHARKTVSAGLGTPPSAAALIYGASNTFAVKPYGFKLTSMTCANNFSAHVTAYCPAGETFSGTVSAVRYDSTQANNLGAVTPSFGQDAQSVTYVPPKLVTPSGGTSGTLTEAYGLWSGGSATASFGWSDVGEIKLTPSIDYSGDLTSNGKTDSEAFFGQKRFYPYRMSLVDNGSLEACGASNLTYAGQPFSLGFDLTAVQKNGAAVNNYGLTSLKTTGAALTVAVENAVSGTNLGGNVKTYPAGAVPSFTLTWPAGVPAATVSVAASQYQYARTGAPFAALDASKIGFLFQDDSGDSVPLLFGDFNPVPSGACIPPTCTARSMFDTQLRYGRARVANAFGSALLPLKINVRTEYYKDATDQWRTNMVDNCAKEVNVPTGAINGGLLFVASEVPGKNQLSNTDPFSPELIADIPWSSVSASPPKVNMPFNAGQSVIRLRSPSSASAGPGATNFGYVEIDFGASGFAWPTWLPSASSRPARAEFGLYKGTDRIIYRREAR